MNSYMCIDMRNDILHTHIFMTCLRQYLPTIVVLRWFFVVVLFDHKGSLLGSRYVCCILCGMVHNELVYNKAIYFIKVGLHIFSSDFVVVGQNKNKWPKTNYF